MSLKPPAPPRPDEDVDWDLTIRFSASLPDLLLSIPGSLDPNTATLKQLIRSRLPDQYAKHRIRLIYAGKALVDDAALATSLRRNLSRPPSRIGTPGPYDDTTGGKWGAARDTAREAAGDKGKLAVRDSPTPSRIYIHCSIGDLVLSSAELAAEAAAAAAAQHGASTEASKEPSTKVPGASAATATATPPAPRGFDRLLHAGFSAAEVQSLRLQFLAIQAHTHTPDTMPSPNTLRNLEDRWLDNSTSDADADGLGPGTGLGGVVDDDVQVGALDDMIWGTAMGFFWPVGCLMWAMREEGIWSQRRKMAVVVGFMLNVGLGIIRYTG